MRRKSPARAGVQETALEVGHDSSDHAHAGSGAADWQLSPNSGVADRCRHLLRHCHDLQRAGRHPAATYTVSCADRWAGPAAGAAGRQRTFWTVIAYLLQPAGVQSMFGHAPRMHPSDAAALLQTCACWWTWWPAAMPGCSASRPALLTWRFITASGSPVTRRGGPPPRPVAAGTEVDAGDRCIAE